MASPNATSAYDHLLKILLIGDSSSNKRTLLKTYIGDLDISDTTTLGLDYKLKDVHYKGKRIKLQLWDTAGQERFRSVTASYYRGAHGALLVFSLQRETSFISLNYWLEEIRNNAPVRFQVVLVATDPSADESEVNIDIARQFAREKQLQLVECDVDKLPHTERTFAAIVEKIMESWDGKTAIDSIRLDQTPYDQETQPLCPC